MAEPLSFWDTLKTQALNDIRGAVVTPLQGALAKSYQNTVLSVQNKVSGVGGKLVDASANNTKPSPGAGSATPGPGEIDTSKLVAQGSQIAIYAAALLVLWYFFLRKGNA